jgi:glycosyltransferase involved in cell wall biosynthesis
VRANQNKEQRKLKPNVMVIFTLVKHKIKDGQLYGYAPYISEMNIWNNHFKEIIVVAPFDASKDLEKIDLRYIHNNIKLISIPSFHVKSWFGVLNFIGVLPSISIKMVRAMRKADYFHFRSPSNVAAIAAVLQVFFPNKPKSTKYAGNWDPNSEQPWGYRFQKWLLTNSQITKNMKVLVYGEWKNQTRYVQAFMPASYSANERLPFKPKSYSNRLKFVFLGAMVDGKRPLFTVKIIQSLIEEGLDGELHMFGDGNLIAEVRKYVNENKLQDVIFVHGNQDKNRVKSALLDAHFTILPSKSEGWPKAIAEGMFFGAIPISTKISCLPWILDNGNRGILIESDLEEAVYLIKSELQKGDQYLNTMASKALEWSQQYTIDKLEKEIEKVVTNA